MLPLFAIADIDSHSYIPASARTGDLPDRLPSFANTWHRSRTWLSFCLEISRQDELMSIVYRAALLPLVG